MMKEQKHETDVLFMIVTFLIYAIVLLLFVSLGAKVYRSVTHRLDLHQSQRTAESYLREKIHQNDQNGAVNVENIGDQTVLQLTETIGEKEYKTYIYTDDGMLKELLIPTGRDVRLSDGTALIPMKRILFQQEEAGILTISMEFDEETIYSFQISRKSEQV